MIKKKKKNLSLVIDIAKSTASVAKGLARKIDVKLDSHSGDYTPAPTHSPVSELCVCVNKKKSLTRISQPLMYSTSGGMALANGSQTSMMVKLRVSHDALFEWTKVSML